MYVENVLLFKSLYSNIHFGKNFSVRLINVQEMRMKVEEPNIVDYKDACSGVRLERFHFSI